MNCKILSISIWMLLFLSCRKDKNQLLDIQGEYIGNQYHWRRAYDSAHNIVVKYDTVFNHVALLELKLDSNIIRFDGQLFKLHDDLNLIGSKDTIWAMFNYPTSQNTNIDIIKSQRKIIYHYGYSSPSGPNAGSIDATYLKK